MTEPGVAQLQVSASPVIDGHVMIETYYVGSYWGARVLTSPVMAEVLRAMALAWDPEWGVASSEAHRQMAVKGFPHPGTLVGWVLYFSRLRGPVPTLPAPVAALATSLRSCAITRF